MITYKVLLKETEEIISLLENTIWGMKGPLFSHQDIKHRIRSNKKNYYFCAFNNNKLIGLIVCCERQGHIAETSDKITCVYTRYFSVSPEFRGQKIGETLLNNAETYFHDHFTKEPAVFYAYQDKKNASSMKVADNKNISIYSEFRTFTFSRISPIKTVAIRKESLDSITSIKLNRNNTEHHVEIEDSKTYVLRDNEENIMCAARFLPSKWSIVKIPGWQGWLMKYVISRFPYLKRLFNRESFRFLAVDHLTLSSSCRDVNLEHFLNGVLSLEKENICLIWSDTKDANYNLLNNLKRPGLLEKLNSNVPACIRLEHKNLTFEQQNALKENAFFISSADLT